MSPNQNLSRRDFLKATLLSLTATFLATCGRALGIPATPASTLLLISNCMNTR
jgi:hypothetical protein